MANITIIASPEFENKLQEFGKRLQLNDLKIENKGAVREETYNLDFDLKGNFVAVISIILTLPPALSSSIDLYNKFSNHFKETVQEHVQQTKQPVYFMTEESSYVFSYDTPESEYQEFLEELKAIQFPEEKKRK